MTRPYSEDLRERAVARYEAGETTRSIAAALRISPSCVSKWSKRKRETGPEVLRSRAVQEHSLQRTLSFSLETMQALDAAPRPAYP